MPLVPPSPSFENSLLTFMMERLTSGKVLIESLEDSEGKTQFNSEITFGTTLRTSVGRIIIEKTPYYHIPEKDFKIDVLRSSIIPSKSKTIPTAKISIYFSHIAVVYIVFFLLF